MARDEKAKMSVDEAKDAAIDFFKKATDFIEEEAENGMVSVSGFFKKLKESFKNIDWKKVPDWDDDDDIDIDSIGT